jgi:hypothetical protein
MTRWKLLNRPRFDGGQAGGCRRWAFTGQEQPHGKEMLEQALSIAVSPVT